MAAPDARPTPDAANFRSPRVLRLLASFALVVIHGLCQVVWRDDGSPIPIRWNVTTVNMTSVSVADNSSAIHFIQLGPPRTATTLQFICVTMALFLSLEDKTVLQQRMLAKYTDTITQIKFERDVPLVVKIHTNYIGRHPLSNYIKENVLVFSTAESKIIGATMRESLKGLGLKNLVFTQDLGQVAEKGHLIAETYADIFGLNASQSSELVEYIRYWDILRVCCGMQMSKHWRSQLLPHDSPLKTPVDTHSPRFPACSMYDIDEVERLFLNSTLYKKTVGTGVEKRIKMGRPSQVDGEMTGSYCSRYNELVKTQGVGFNENEHGTVL